MTASQAKKIIDLIDRAKDQIVALDIETDYHILCPLDQAEELIFDSFSGESYEELNSLFDIDHKQHYEDEIYATEG